MSYSRYVTVFFGGKKKFLWLAGVAIVLTSLAIRLISITYWDSIEWNMVSYHPSLPFLGMFWALLYMSILYVKRIRLKSLWMIGIIGLLYAFIMFWAMYLR